MQNMSWGGRCGALRVAASSNQLNYHSWLMRAAAHYALIKALDFAEAGAVRLHAYMQLVWVTVQLASESAIITATRLMFERMKLVVEPSGAMPLAALLEAPASRKAKRIGVIVSVGNVDLDALLDILKNPGAY